MNHVQPCCLVSSVPTESHVLSPVYSDCGTQRPPRSVTFSLECSQPACAEANSTSRSGMKIFPGKTVKWNKRERKILDESIVVMSRRLMENMMQEEQGTKFVHEGIVKGKSTSACSSNTEAINLTISMSDLPLCFGSHAFALSFGDVKYSQCLTI